MIDGSLKALHELTSAEDTLMRVIVLLGANLISVNAFFQRFQRTIVENYSSTS